MHKDFKFFCSRSEGYGVEDGIKIGTIIINNDISQGQLVLGLRSKYLKSSRIVVHQTTS
jgi:hypothetical protein